MPDAFLEIVANLARHHREHEKHYAEAPLADAVRLLQMSRALKALAERWTTAVPGPAMISPYAGAPELNDERAIEAAGILFMEDGRPPAEIVRLRRDLATLAGDAEEIGTWLAAATDTAWGVAEGLLRYPQLYDLLGERHRIIANDAQNAALATLTAKQLRRADRFLDEIDFTAAALREDLASERRAPDLLFSATELIDHAAELAAYSATLVSDNERRWRVFGRRVAALTEPDRDAG